ncbi:RluA family pseudouridine synthase [Paenibacillus sp. UNC451MF]|uniref:RluA family pseudouridine synthase n=1 Tax=Paenibacillus sp. UNC451MF TaxID=1449063 RepID=UPI00048E4CE0|nr:RluA family pseudouridine synthase [Paenibacillus sp. UNC451MF]
MIPWQKKGEWLELRLPRPLDSEADIKQYISLSDKYLNSLIKTGGLSIKGPRVRLRLFPNEPIKDMPKWAPIEVLYEDDFCLVVQKPAGMKVHGDPSVAVEQAATLWDAVASYYEATGQRCKVRHIHRLDEDTTGPVLYAKHEWSQLVLDGAMREKQINRQYAAIVQGRIKEKSGIIDAAIGRDRHHSARRRVSPTGERAVTHYEVEQQWPQGALVKLRLETGRTHQIRVHMSYLGHPIWGDELYGGKKQSMSRQALHGERLIFNHPLTSEQLDIECPWPQDMKNLCDQLQKI